MNLASKLAAINELLVYGLANGWSVKELNDWLQTPIGKEAVQDVIDRDKQRDEQTIVQDNILSN